MKKVLTLWLIIITAICIHAQHLNSDEVPAAVIASFTEKYGQIKNIHWRKTTTNLINAAFRMKDQRCVAAFDINGNWHSTHTNQQMNDLPVPVQAVLKKEYLRFTLRDMQRVEMASCDVFFSITATQNGKTNNVIISPEGRTR